jgi:hypothetical protein
MQIKMTIPVPQVVGQEFGWYLLTSGPISSEFVSGNSSIPEGPGETVTQSAIPAELDEFSELSPAGRASLAGDTNEDTTQSNTIPEETIDPELTIQDIEASPSPELKTSPEVLMDIRAELERLGERIRQPGISRSDGRYPVYVIFSTRTGL